MAVQNPKRFVRQSAARPSRWAGDDAVPRGLAVASAVMLRVLIVFGGIVLLGLAAQQLLIVVLPLLIAVMFSTLLSPLARRMERPAPGAAAALAVIVAVQGRRSAPSRSWACRRSRSRSW